jgi:acetyltransferase-like isoleucine patch superfamily enzyme
LNDAAKIKIGNIDSSDVEIGRFTYGYEKIQILQWGEGASLKIGSFCSIADPLTIMLGGNHRVDWITTFPFGHIFEEELGGTEIKGHPATKGNVVIGNDVWIGRNATIMSGITIGDGAVIAADSTIVKDVGNYETWGGNPACKIKNRFNEDIVKELLNLEWWNLEIEVIKKIIPLLSKEPDLKTLDAIRILASSHEH